MGGLWGQSIRKQGQVKEGGWSRKLGAVGSWMTGRQQRSGKLRSCNPRGRRSGPRGDVRVASPSFPSRSTRLPPFLFSTTLLFSSPLLHSAPLHVSPVRSPPPFPSLQGSGRSPAQPSTRRASAAFCRALTSFCGAERRAAAACAAPWRTNAWLAAPWTASAPARRRPRRAAPAPRWFGPLSRPPANRGPRHPGSSSPEVFPARPPASRHRRRLLARAPRAPGRRCACGDPGEAQAGLRTQGGPHLVGGRRDCCELPSDDGHDPPRSVPVPGGVARRVPRARECGEIHGVTVDPGLSV